MLPTRPKEVTLVEVLNRLLDKGLFLKAELVLTLADVPLIKINLNAMISGAETWSNSTIKPDGNADATIKPVVLAKKPVVLAKIAKFTEGKNG